MSLLFHVDLNNRAILHPEVIKLCPALSVLTEKELLYIILAYDYNSPYRQFPDHDRKRQAMWHAFEENESDLIESEHILTCAEHYISLQYSPKIETAKVYQKSIDRYQDRLLAEDDPAKAKKIGDAIDDFTRRIKALHNDYDKDMQKRGVVKGKMELSYIESLMSNMKNYEAITSQQPKLK